MAVARLVCGDCGAPLSFGDTRCSSCGAGVETPAPAASPATSASMRCEVCGHVNASGSVACSSCGARLGSVREKKKPPAARVSTSAGGKTAAAGAKRFEPWQVISALAVLGLIAYLAYVSIGGDKGVSRAPASAQATAPMPMMQDIGPLQAAVDANPKDPAALLQLANALHDNRTYARAAELYRRYLALVPANPDARVDLGVCYFELGQQDSAQAGKYFAMAVQEMQTAVKGSPSHQPAAFNLAVVYLHMGEIGESNRWFKRAVELNKDSELGKRAQVILEQHSSIQ